MLLFAKRQKEQAKVGAMFMSHENPEDAAPQNEETGEVLVQEERTT